MTEEPRFRPLESAWRAFIDDISTNQSLCPICRETPAEYLLERIQRRNWNRIITELEEHLPLRVIGRLLHKTKPTVWGWKVGSEPKESDGRRLLALHAKYCGNKP
jgi:hypothetical protein